MSMVTLFWINIYIDIISVIQNSNTLLWSTVAKNILYFVASIDYECESHTELCYSYEMFICENIFKNDF